jgi:hypothetical protein
MERREKITRRARVVYRQRRGRSRLIGWRSRGSQRPRHATKGNECRLSIHIVVGRKIILGIKLQPLHQS